MRVLIVEDDLTISSKLKKSLEQESFVVDTVEDGYMGSYIARTNSYDLVALDLALPRKNGSEVLSDIRSKTKDVPVLIMSNQSDVNQKVRLLENADDYLVKPFTSSEFVARIKAILRRPNKTQSTNLQVDDLTINRSANTVFKTGKEIYLTRKEFMLLDCLATERGKVISRGEIMEKVWNHDSDPFSNTIEAHIRNLRKKIDFGKHKLIKTVSGRGYKID